MSVNKTVLSSQLPKTIYMYQPISMSSFLVYIDNTCLFADIHRSIMYAHHRKYLNIVNVRKLD